ncbi:cystatin-9-like [Lutra lutra]|uniref:Cystatin-9-like n=1 Tax=Enhydra lutris kenyoni TaxID=391180 RepID=A0A2Y9IMQ6_ENHLU|nr:cystatin-9-like [Enhydra lutris kenyoni]XP_047602744.1 cystatin-9-like [Lutra lutra]
MLHLLFRWALPRAMLLLLLGSQLLVTPGSRSEEEAENKYQNAMRSYFLGTVEYALHIFNLQSNDTRAYRLVRILNSRRELSLEKNTMAFSMELQLRRTRCGKFDDDIDNCPFQESSGQNNIITCFFIISTEPWNTEFELWNKTCLEGHLHGSVG